MRRLTYLTGLCAALSLSMAPQAWAADPGARPTPAAVQDQDAFSVWLGEATAWSNEYQLLMGAATQVFVSVIDQADRAEAQLNSGNGRTYSAWARDVRTRHLTAMDGIDRQYAALPPNLPAPPAALATDPEVARLVRYYDNTRDRIGTLLRQMRGSMVTYFDLMAAASSKRDSDMVALRAGVLDLVSAQLSAENLMLEQIGMAPGEPGYYFHAAQMANNDGLKIWLGFLRDYILGHPPDGKATAAAMLQAASAQRAAAEDMRTAMTRTVATLLNDPASRSTPLADIAPRVRDIFHRSADVELQLAQVTEDMANLVREGDIEGAVARSQATESLVATRVQLGLERNQMLASMGQ